jgi:hypothetical protein
MWSTRATLSLVKETIPFDALARLDAASKILGVVAELTASQKAKDRVRSNSGGT